MSKRNSKNERIKRQYSEFLKHADGKAEATIRQVEKAIQRYESFTSSADFATFDQRRAKAFKAHLVELGLSKATMHSGVTALKRFFGWLAHQSGYKSRIAYTDIEYLNLADKEVRAAKARLNARIQPLNRWSIQYHGWPRVLILSVGIGLSSRSRPLPGFETVPSFP